MIIRQITPEGEIEREATPQELRAMAKEGNREAIRELIENAGGWSALTQEQKERAIRLLLGYEIDLVA
jgi:hypothetical protein